jgi:hypothetical protein
MRQFMKPIRPILNTKNILIFLAATEKATKLENLKAHQKCNI